MSERAASRWHLTAGFLFAVLGTLSWLFSWNGYASALAVFLCNLYLVSLLLEASFRAQQERRFVDGVPQPKAPRFFQFPERTWSLLQIQFLLAAVILGFANLYIQSGAVQYQGPVAVVQKPDRPVHTAQPPTASSSRLVNRVDAAYYSAVTFSTVGYGEYVPTSSGARLLALWEIGTAMLLLLGVFPLIVGRISDF